MSMRKILIPVAAGLLFSPALMAADLKGQSTSRTFGDEFLSTFGAAATVTGDVLRVELEAEYTLGDIVTLDFSGGALKGSSVPTTATAPVTESGDADSRLKRTNRPSSRATGTESFPFETARRLAITVTGPEPSN